ncbi:OmpW family outer membrane protein [Pseudophaeobacter sp.]|jgi:outer membrane protein|uniref:Outer membrane beta-barrel protein n=1 Tax=Pseudophaeobacter arcticus TaxID=385492 RepID=A0ABQ0AKB2_9RHOB|nr:OmpW family outer membrane protein [uncultured Pseudophaeobacter sp.]UWS81188.1 outer membrane beta-barrel protein [Phaeobacter sp. G2]
MKRSASILALATACTVLAVPAFAQSQGDWTFGVGVINVNPKSDNGTLAGAPATMTDDTQISLTAEYFIRDNLGIELLAATPFEHDINIGGAFAGTSKQLPPTLSINYHFPTKGNIKPFIGAGINYTTFFEEQSALGVLELKDSWGFALQAGADWQISDNGALRLNVRYMDIDSDAFLNGASIGKAEIDPVTIGVSYVHRF